MTERCALTSPQAETVPGGAQPPLGAETHRLVAERIHAVLWILLAVLPPFAALEWFTDRGQIGALYTIKLVQLVAVVVAVVALRHPRASRHQVGVAVGFLGMLTLTAAASNILRHDITLTPLLLIVLALGSATFLPWGVRAQWAIVAIASLAFTANTLAARDVLDLQFAYLAIAVVVAFVGSLYLAHTFEHYHLTIRRQTIELRASEERYREMVENASDMVYTHDLHGVITSINHAGERLTGYTRADACGMHITQLLPAGQLTMRDEDPPGTAELEITTRDGRRVTLDIHAQLAFRNGRAVGWQGVVRDVTERKRVEAELAAAKEAAEAANRAKSTFVANMSHDIRTPMNGILGMTELLLDTPLSDEQREYVDLIRTSADGLETLVNDILDLSKIEAGKLDLTPVVFSLRGHLEETIKPLRVRAAQKHLLLSCAVDASVPDGVVGDPARLRQILVNLVGNALKFTERGAVAVEVEIANRESRIAHCGGVGQFEIRDSQSEIALHFVVRDSGVGIATAQQQRIFNAFEQAAGSTDHAVRGSGLGLAIVSKLVAMMGGTVWVQSEVGRGSVFHFTVRLGRAEQAGAATRPAARPGNGAGAAHTTPVAHPAPRALRILVVDDNPDNRRLMVVMLSKRGHSAVEANSGREAVAVVQRERFDAVLMDVQMPDMDGIAATQAIRRWEAEHAGRARLPIIAVTANAMIGDRARCFAAGMDSYLAKPFRVEQLVLALEALTGPTRSPEDAAAPAASAL